MITAPDRKHVSGSASAASKRMQRMPCTDRKELGMEQRAREFENCGRLILKLMGY